jgi:hypothetical protein
MSVKKVATFKLRQSTSDTSSVLFPVEVQSLRFNNPAKEKEIIGDRGVAVIRKDTHKIICTASSEYQLQTHGEVLKAVELLFKKNKIAFTVSDVRTGGTRGNRMYVNYILPQYQFVVHRTDKYIPFLQVQNSYDKSLLFNLTTGIFRQICSNGAIITHGVKFLTKKHVHENINLEEIEINIAAWASNLGIVKLTLEKLANRKLTKKRVEEVTAKVFNRKRDLTGFVDLKLIDKNVKEVGNNEYALFNALTEYATHVLGSFTDNYDYTNNAYRRISKILLGTE